MAENQNKPILKVRHLRVSFKTNTGTVKAVRGIDFSLFKGRTLAIVGESGSGKSVTSKAILGILANNKIIEDGRIIYDGKDLLTLPEKKFTKVRGVKISMIFQDPLSALNPIMKVGKQLTEAMVLESKSLRKEAHKYVKNVRKSIANVCKEKEKLNLFDAACSSINTFNVKICREYITVVDSYIKNVINSRDLLNDFGLACKSLKDENELLSELQNKYYPLFQEGLDIPQNTIINKLKENKKAETGEEYEIAPSETLNEVITYYAKCIIVVSGVESKQALTNAEEAEALNELLNRNFYELFLNASNVETIAFVRNLNNAIKVCEDYKAKYLAGTSDQLNVKEAIKALAPMKKALAACKDFFGQDADDIIDVHVVLMKKYLTGMVEADKQTAKLAELLAKNNAETVFDLPANIRTKQREVITSSATYYQSIVKITDRLIKHMKEIKAKYPLVDSINEGANELPIVVQDDEVKGLINFFSKMLVQASHKLTSGEAKARAIQLMKEVGIPDPERRFYQYPFEFSGGMRQRIVIAIALSGNPEILICDEPTTALDVTIQAQILELIQKLKIEKNLSIIFITHDLGVVANMADDIAVMYAGKIVEYGSVYDIFYDPRHPYTWALLSSMPDLDTKGRLDAIPGTPPNMLLPPRGDAFAARNSYAVALDYKQEPPFFKVSETHSVKTWLAHKDAIDVVPPKTVIERIKNSLAKNPSNTPTYDLKKNSVLEILKVKGGK